MTGRPSLADRAMRTYGWDGQAAMAAWADVRARGPASPWWPEMMSVLTCATEDNLYEATAPMRELMRALRQSPLAELFATLRGMVVLHDPLGGALSGTSAEALRTPLTRLGPRLSVKEQQP